MTLVGLLAFADEPAAEFVREGGGLADGIHADAVLAVGDAFEAIHALVVNRHGADPFPDGLLLRHVHRIEHGEVERVVELAGLLHAAENLARDQRLPLDLALELGGFDHVERDLVGVLRALLWLALGREPGAAVEGDVHRAGDGAGLGDFLKFLSLQRGKRENKERDQAECSSWY